MARYEAGLVVPRADTLERLLAACGRQVSARPARVHSSMRLSGPRGRTLLRLRSRVLELAQSVGVRNVRVFGSVARGSDSPDSDIDILVDLAPGQDLLACYELAERLRPLLGDVDVTTEGLLRDDVRRAVLKDAMAL